MFEPVKEKSGGDFLFEDSGGRYYQFTDMDDDKENEGEGSDGRCISCQELSRPEVRMRFVKLIKGLDPC